MGEIPNPLAITGSSLVMISVIGKEQASRPIYADQCCRCDRVKEAVDYTDYSFHIISVSDPDPYGSVSFGRIRFRRYGSGSG